jgi:hypothetical protein
MMKLVKIDDVYINLNQVVAVWFEARGGQVKITVDLLSGGCKVFSRYTNIGENPSEVLDRFIEELRPRVEI